MNVCNDLFVVEHDDRIERLKRYLKFQLAYGWCGYPTVKQLVEISDIFGVSGRKPLEIVEELIQERYTKYHGEDDS